MIAANTEHLDRIAAYLRQKRDGEISLVDVVALAEITAESLQTFFETMDTAIYRELRDIADYIVEMKIEIGALQANELKETRIPAAGQQLSAIIESTEAATNSIMECAEAVMAADSSDSKSYKALVDGKMLAIFEACSFQDITGQRIAKVVEALEHIEARVSRFAATMRTKDLSGFINEEEKSRAERKKRLLLNGPPFEGEGNVQTEIDELLQN
jgi:chemotaxis protein CheZ